MSNEQSVLRAVGSLWGEQQLNSQSVCEVESFPEDFSGDRTPVLIRALEAIGRGEDLLSRGIERTTDNLVRISYQHYPKETKQLLIALSHIDSAIDGMVELVDDSTGNIVSTAWQKLDEHTQARILGAGKVLAVLVPVSKVKGLKELTACQHFGRNGAFRQAKREAGIPVSQEPFSIRKVEMTGCAA
ncbi:MAG: hypothetical protein ACR2PT_06835 [Endozoicomonas sp.]